jgi:hypothetical protein
MLSVNVLLMNTLKITINLRNYVMTDLYRVEMDSVFELCSYAGCYIFIGKLNGKSLEQFIREYEND